jgi:tRNA(Ser,Leu) C12 N-acetylase TAN1
MMTIEDPARESSSSRHLVTGWNVLATAKNHEQGHLARRLKRLGDFRWSSYPGLLIGRVADHQAFFEQLRRREEDEPDFLFPLARLLPLERTFEFTTETLLSELSADALDYARRIGNGSFYVRVERRGHKEDLRGREIEQALTGIVLESSGQQGSAPHVTFRDPDFIITVEIVGDECGVGLITRSMRERYPFVRVP